MVKAPLLSLALLLRPSNHLQCPVTSRVVVDLERLVVAYQADRLLVLDTILVVRDEKVEGVDPRRMTLAPNDSMAAEVVRLSLASRRTMRRASVTVVPQ